MLALLFQNVSLLLAYMFIYFTLFYFIDKEVYILKRATQSIQDIHQPPRGTTDKKGLENRKGYNNTTHPQWMPNQSKKLTRVKGPSSINILVHDTKYKQKGFLTFGLDMLDKKLKQCIIYILALQIIFHWCLLYTTCRCRVRPFFLLQTI